ncbi:MAG: hypothetical protein RLZ12_31 [Bacillota bacterium]|jgi:hypothetical protein
MKKKFWCLMGSSLLLVPLFTGLGSEVRAANNAASVKQELNDYVKRQHDKIGPLAKSALRKVNGLIPETQSLGKTSRKKAGMASRLKRSLRGKVKVENLTSAQAYERYKRSGCIAVMNFANEKKPGGGFLHDRTAQEEANMRHWPKAYLSLFQYARKRGWTAGEQYIPSGRVLATPIQNGNLYSAAALAFKRNGQLDTRYTKGIRPSVRKDGNFANNFHYSQINKVINAAAARGDKVLILGAYGCGVYNNTPDKMAKLFAHALNNNKNAAQFKKIIFAIPKTNKRNWNEFKKVFS